MRKPGTRQFIILIEEGSEFEGFYQEEAKRRESGSITKLFHSVLKERYLMMTEKIQQSTYWPGGNYHKVPSPQNNNVTRLEEKRKKPTPPSDDQLLGDIGGMED